MVSSNNIGLRKNVFRAASCAHAGRHGRIAISIYHNNTSISGEKGEIEERVEPSMMPNAVYNKRRMTERKNQRIKGLAVGRVIESSP